jgi:hypothetical protein
MVSVETCDCLYQTCSGVQFPINHSGHNVYHVLKSTISWDVMPCSLVEVYWRFGRNVLSPSSDSKGSQTSKQRSEAKSNAWRSCACFMLLCYSSLPKMEAIRSYETSLQFYQTTWRHITEDRLTLQSHHRETLKSNIAILCFRWKLNHSVIKAIQGPLLRSICDYRRVLDSWIDLLATYRS